MRACPVCGTANNETEDFCTNCGSYLGWSHDEPPEAPDVAARQDAAPETSSPRPATPSQPTGAVAGEGAGRANGAAAPPPETAGARFDVPPVRPVAPEPPASAAQPIVPVQPARPIAPRPVVRPSEVSAATEGTPCPVCGTLNEPARRFCRRCAAPLRADQPTAKLPWWRIWWPFRRRVRIGGSGRWARRLVWLLVIAALVVAGFLLVPAGRGVFESTEDKLGGATTISPTAVSANTAAPGHPATASADGLTNTYWGTPALGDSVTYTFGAPFRLVDVIIDIGASTNPTQFAEQARPTRIDLVATTTSGTQVQHLTLDDHPGPQTIKTGISDVVRISLIPRAAAGTGPGRVIALGEVQFFRRT